MIRGADVGPRREFVGVVRVAEGGGCVEGRGDSTVFVEVVVGVDGKC